MPSLVGGREMNGYEHSRMNGVNGGYNDNFRDDYSRDDMRRDDEDRYRRGMRNGGPPFERFNNSDLIDQQSLSDFRSNEPKFELDHLATFAAGTRNGCIHAEDGLRKLRQMENTTGIWTMRCVLIVERGCLVIVDNSTGEELERFPLQLVQDPTAIFKNDRREIYNNLILFTIVDDPKKRSSQADMHIFQSCKAPAQEIVDEILASKNGQQRLYGGGSRIPPPPVGPAPEPPGGNAYDFQGMREFIDTRQYNSDMRQFNQFNQTNYSQSGQFGGPIGQQRSFITRINTVREKEDLEGGSTEILERDVQLLNHCFDDIEKFVARLQQAAESYKELEKRKRDRGAKNKKRQSGDGMLNARARPPPDRDFVDIFQKFKLSFNLLAKLKAHIHDPNAPELVHFLFTPLSLIYEASRDPYHGNQNLGDQAVAPVLTPEAKQLLLNCLTSKEIELWQALGKHWTTSRDEWNGHIPPYVPEFYDGWQPAAGVIDELTARSAAMSQPPIIAPMPMMDPGRTPAAIEDRSRGYNATRPMPFPDDDRPMMGDRYHREDFERKVRSDIPKNAAPRAMTRQEENEAYYSELKRTSDAVIYEAAHDRHGKNSKELTVQKGDILQVLDSSKNWWKLRNYNGVIGFAPYTILKPLKSDNSYFDRSTTERTSLAPPSRATTSDTSFFDDNVSKSNASRRGRKKSLKNESVMVSNWVQSPTFQEQSSEKQTRFQHTRDDSRGSSIDLDTPPTRRRRRSVSPRRRPSRSPSPRRRRPHSPTDRGSVSPPRYRNKSPSSRDSSPCRRGYSPRRRTPPRQRKNSPPPEPPQTYGSSIREYRQASSPGRYSSPAPRRRNNSPPPEPPPAKPLYALEGSKYDVDLKPVNGNKNKKEHYDELRSKVNNRQLQRSFRVGEVTRLTKHSSSKDVAEWLTTKGFSDMVMETFVGYNGLDMFQLHLNDIKDLLGHDEAIRLDGLLTLQKSTSGYATRSAKELNAILQKRKQHVNQTDPDYATFEEAQPETREQNYPERDSGDYARRQGATVNLRDLLVRQKSQLRQSNASLDML